MYIRQPEEEGGRMNYARVANDVGVALFLRINWSKDQLSFIDS